MFYNCMLDLDGTVADFNTKADEILLKYSGKTFYECDHDLAWTILAERCPDLYKDLELLPNAEKLIDFLDRIGFQVLTAIPSKAIFPNITSHKRDWVEKHMGRRIHTLFGPYSVDKQFHCKRSNDLLIDNNPLCIVQWKDRGGVAIHHKDCLDTIAKLKLMEAK